MPGPLAGPCGRLRGCSRWEGNLAVAFNAAWPGGCTSADAANTSADLAEIINHLLAPDTGGRFSTGVLRRTRRRGGTYQGPARHLGLRQSIAAGRWRIGSASHGAAADRPGPQSGDQCHLLGAMALVTCGAPLQVGMLPSASANGNAHSRAMATSPSSSPGTYPYSYWTPETPWPWLSAGGARFGPSGGLPD